MCPTSIEVIIHLYQNTSLSLSDSCMCVPSVCCSGHILPSEHRVISLACVCSFPALQWSCASIIKQLSDSVCAFPGVAGISAAVGRWRYQIVCVCAFPYVTVIMYFIHKTVTPSCVCVPAYCCSDVCLWTWHYQTRVFVCLSWYCSEHQKTKLSVSRACAFLCVTVISASVRTWRYQPRAHVCLCYSSLCPFLNMTLSDSCACVPFQRYSSPCLYQNMMLSASCACVPLPVLQWSCAVRMAVPGGVVDRGTCCQGPWPSSTTGPSTNTTSSPRKGRLLHHCTVFNTYTHTSLCPLRQFKRCNDNVFSFLCLFAVHWCIWTHVCIYYYQPWPLFSDCVSIFQFIWLHCIIWHFKAVGDAAWETDMWRRPLSFTHGMTMGILVAQFRKRFPT